MHGKRVAIFAGHYGSGKTNIAVNYALWLKQQGKDVLIADLDIVNPYFRTKDSLEELQAANIEVISSPFANSNVDVPGLPEAMYRICRDKRYHAVVDVGGDDQGAVALGRYTPELLEENSYDMFFVANAMRPLTRDPKDALEVMREIEAAGGIRFTGIINNANLATETDEEVVMAGERYCKTLSEISGLPHVLTSVDESLYDVLKGKIDNLFPLKLQKKYFL